MEVVGIKFAPINIPLERRLQTLTAGLWFYTLALGGPVGLLISLYLLLFSSYWLGTLFYLIWTWVIDIDTCERGGRRLNWARNLFWWKYMRDYFPINLKKLPEVELDPKKNYLFCCFPHGILPVSAFAAFATNACDYNKLCPNHTPHLLTLKQHFWMPYFREYLYSLGMCSSSAESMKWLLNQRDGGNVAILTVGGTAEAFYAKPGQYRLVLKNRKGFIKMAMKTGSPLVPVFSFGETDVFDQVSNPIGSPLRTFQEWVKKMAGVAPLIPVGRGFLQYTFGWVPHRKHITIVIGKPLEVSKVENPTEEEVNALHETFVNQLTELFETQKHQYIKNPEDVHLIID